MTGSDRTNTARVGACGPSLGTGLSIGRSQGRTSEHTRGRKTRETKKVESFQSFIWLQCVIMHRVWILCDPIFVSLYCVFFFRVSCCEALSFFGRERRRRYGVGSQYLESRREWILSTRGVQYRGWCLGDAEREGRYLTYPFLRKAMCG